MHIFNGILAIFFDDPMPKKLIKAKPILTFSAF